MTLSFRALAPSFLALGLVLGLLLVDEGVEAAGPLDRVTAQVPRVFCLRARVSPLTYRYATGVQVAPARMLTVWHEVEGVEAIEAFTHDGLRSPAQVLASDDALDLALLEIAPRPGAVKLNDWPVKANEPIFIIGCPEGAAHTVRMGRVGNPRILLAERDLLELTLTIHRGDSGAPVFDGQGHLVGLIQGYREEDQAVAYAIPADVLLRFLVRAGLAEENLSALSRQKVEALVSEGADGVADLLHSRQRAAPGDPWPYLMLGLWYQRRGGAREALTALLEAAERGPRQERVFQALCEVYRTLGWQDAARRSCHYADRLQNVTP